MTTRKTAELLDLYERMYLIRQVELRLGRLFADGEVPGFIHLSIGQEAVATGVASVLRIDDSVASTHRGHGHALAKGVDVERFFLELMAKEEGICKGRAAPCTWRICPSACWVPMPSSAPVFPLPWAARSPTRCATLTLWRWLSSVTGRWPGVLSMKA